MVAFITRATRDDLDRMRDKLFIDEPDRGRKLSGFWVLMVLSSVIASAGVASDSTATVIGAMLVAPLLTPIMGVVLSVVIADRRNLLTSAMTLAGGVLTGITIGYLFAMLLPIQPSATSNSQIAGRVSPGLIDLISALAVGVAGAFSQVRRDLAGSLPGVAIAISLVPPLAVVGITLRGGDTRSALGAMLLFLTNVAAILLTGVLTMLAYRIDRLPSRRVRSGGTASEEAGTARERELGRKRAIRLIVVATLIIAAPLAASSYSVIQETRQRSAVGRVITAWAAKNDWRLVEVTRTGTTGDRSGTLTALVSGMPPAPDTDTLRNELDANGLQAVSVEVRLVPEERVALLGSGAKPTPSSSPGTG